MLYVWHEIDRHEEIKRREKTRKYCHIYPTARYERIRHIHLPVKFMMEHLNDEDWKVLEGRMTYEDFDSLRLRLAQLDHSVREHIPEKPCCGSVKYHPNPAYAVYVS